MSNWEINTRTVSLTAQARALIHSRRRLWIGNMTSYFVVDYKIWAWSISLQSLQSPRPNHHCNAHPKHQHQPQTLFSHHKPVITLQRQSGSRTIQSSISGQPSLSPIHFHLLIRILSSCLPKKSSAPHEPAASRSPITRPINREMLVKKSPTRKLQSSAFYTHPHSFLPNSPFFVVLQTQNL